MTTHNGKPIYQRGGADAGRGDDAHGVTPKWSVRWNSGRVMDDPKGTQDENTFANFDGGWEIHNNERLDDGPTTAHTLAEAEDFLHNNNELDYEVETPTDPKDLKKSQRHNNSYDPETGTYK